MGTISKKNLLFNGLHWESDSVPSPENRCHVQVCTRPQEKKYVIHQLSTPIGPSQPLCFLCCIHNPTDTLSNRALKSQIKFWLEENDKDGHLFQQDYSKVDVSSELMDVGLFAQSPESSSRKKGTSKPKSLKNLHGTSSKKGSSKPKSLKNLFKVGSKSQHSATAA